MRCQPVSKCAEARTPRSGLWTVSALASVLLAGCFGEEADRRQAARDAGDFPTINEQINRSGKGDRLRISERPARRSVAEAAAAAVRAAGGGEPLVQFYRALVGVRSGRRREPVSILHLGDSHIAADRFSGDLRALLQVRFGDAGRGMMMPGFPFPYYQARGVRFSREGNWSVANSFKKDPGPYGLSGVRVSAREKGARLSLVSEDGAFEWAEVAFLTQPQGGEAEVTFGGARRMVMTVGSENRIKRVRIDRKGRELEVVTRDKGAVSILSWAVGQNRPGLRYVNFGIPGASADTPRRWNNTLVADGLSSLQPDLIILGYGTNESFNDDLDLPAYEARVAQLVERLKDRAPQASLLILGPPDTARFPRFARGKGNKAPPDASCQALSDTEMRDYARLKKAKAPQLARWHGPPNLTAVRESLTRVAETHGAHFWDWSRVMGSACGIHAWAQKEPPLAASDHVHLRSEGARRSAQALFDELMSGFEAHVRLASR